MTHGELSPNRDLRSWILIYRDRVIISWVFICLSAPLARVRIIIGHYLGTSVLLSCQGRWWVFRSAWNPGLESQLCHSSRGVTGQCAYPIYPSNKNNNGTYFSRLLGGPNGIMFQQCLAPCLARGKCSVRGKGGREGGFPQGETWVRGNRREIGGPAS